MGKSHRPLFNRVEKLFVHDLGNFGGKVIFATSCFYYKVVENEDFRISSFQTHHSSTDRLQASEFTWKFES